MRPSAESGQRYVVIGLLWLLAARLAFADPESLNALLHLPLSLLVTFLVPLIIAGHVVVFWRLAMPPASGAVPARATTRT